MSPTNTRLDDFIKDFSVDGSLYLFTRVNDATGVGSFYVPYHLHLTSNDSQLRLNNIDGNSSYKQSLDDVFELHNKSDSDETTRLLKSRVRYTVDGVEDLSDKWRTSGVVIDKITLGKNKHITAPYLRSLLARLGHAPQTTPRSLIIAITGTLDKTDVQTRADLQIMDYPSKSIQGAYASGFALMTGGIGVLTTNLMGKTSDPLSIVGAAAIFAGSFLAVYFRRYAEGMTGYARLS